MMDVPMGKQHAASSPRSLLLPLALGQFICSYAATNMNVAVNNISFDLGVTVIEIQTAITSLRSSWQPS